MKHAREDYDRIQDPAGLIPEDEPVFLLRGQDLFAWAVVEVYATRLEAFGGDPAMVALCREQVKRMKSWRKRKFPDLPTSTEVRA